jgi:hypothetical protein
MVVTETKAAFCSGVGGFIVCPSERQDVKRSVAPTAEKARVRREVINVTLFVHQVSLRWFHYPETDVDTATFVHRATIVFDDDSRTPR